MLKKLLFLFCFYSFNLYSQSFPIIVCSAGNVSNSFVYYNLGEPITATLAQNPLILTQGFIQPPPDTAISDIILTINEKNENGIEILAYPNPFKDDITLLISNADLQNCVIQVVDVLGRIVPVTCKIENAITSAPKFILNTSMVGEGNYFIRVIVKKQMIKVIKIIKL